ncbi:ubiquitin-like-specific protease 1D isoform X2 [Tripterygium wilfordii]|uniref:Ubiquitin-like-specific protease 1D isoform X2 n=1 Tax=Tripterygium wilfordii TaxID=458696 RepID=A0A7J7D420_TRIWF|nr:ubiquitin-like-specific protease 1D [Tripterygium wilfordii]KAF5741063.1 ubiquitin-like-specific protease 1D isoform X2 [Tripterygium wilfordii]
MEEEKNPRKRPLELDMDALLDRNDDAEPLQLLIVNTREPPPKPSPMAMDHQPKDDFSRVSDRDLEEQIKRQKRNIQTIGKRLRDGGEKLRATIKALEKECERRRLQRAVQVDADGCEKASQSTSSGALESSTRDTSSHLWSQSSFASHFSKKMEEKTDCRVANAFDNELSILGHCDRSKTKSNGDLSQRERQKDRSSSRQLPFGCASSLSHSGKKHLKSYSDHKGRASSLYPFNHSCDQPSSCSPREKGIFGVWSSNGLRSRKGQTVVLSDDEEPEVVETTEQADKLDESMKDAKIYYPSRDDPASVEICYTDINCLGPEAYLTSPIMNFYIQYLQRQVSPANRAICDYYHFFSTYFYKKLKEAVSYQGSDKESFFIKFRRWWKGVNIFQKAYILIPVHEDVHWSLVIICIPDKEDESGPIILHLDSLGLHCSRAIFETIKRFLKEEWNYLNSEVAPSDIPIGERIWKNLPRRIDDKIITVPQQKNDYDCGLFVLFFMKRFIEEAPERLNKKDLAMFGKQWFKPEEASGLRKKIRNLLLEEFKKVS